MVQIASNLEAFDSPPKTSSSAIWSSKKSASLEALEERENRVRMGS
jgi:hypothetical protein